MCRWLAYSGPPIYLDELLLRPEHSLLTQSLHARESTFEVNADIVHAVECNCSICCKKGALHFRAEPEQVRNVPPELTCTNPPPDTAGLPFSSAAIIDSATSRIVGGRYQSLEQWSKRLAQVFVKKTEQPYEPYIPDWDEWEPPTYVGVYEEGEMVGYYRRNPEIEVLGMETGA